MIGGGCGGTTFWRKKNKNRRNAQNAVPKESISIETAGFGFV